MFAVEADSNEEALTKLFDLDEEGFDLSLGFYDVLDLCFEYARFPVKEIGLFNVDEDEQVYINPTKPYFPFTPRDFIDGVRKLYEEWLEMKQERDPSLVGLPDFVSAIDHFEKHGIET